MPKQKTTSKPIISSTTHHTYKLNIDHEAQQRKVYFARLRGYRDRK